MQIDDVMALVDEYVSASIEDHGYRSGAASAEYLEDTKRKLLAAIESLIAAPQHAAPQHAAPQQAEPVEIVPRVWREALRKLTFIARTSGGTPGPDEGLQTACAEAETLLSKPYNYPPAAPQQVEPVAWRDHVEQRLHNWRQRTMNRSGDRLALDDMMSKESIDDLIDYVCDEWSDPAAPQQAEPCDVCNALTVPRNATHYDADDLKAAQVRGKIIAAKLQQQAEPVAQIGWADEFGNLFPMGAWKPAQRTHHDSHKTAWRPVFLHPPAAEVQRLRDALTAICAVADDREEGNYDTVPIHFIRSIARDATKGGK